MRSRLSPLRPIFTEIMLTSLAVEEKGPSRRQILLAVEDFRRNRTVPPPQVEHRQGVLAHPTG